MAQIVNVNFKMDAEDKRRMESACAGMGLSMSAAFTIFAKKVGRERRIPFEISAPDPFYDENNIRYLENKMADYKAERTLQQLRGSVGVSKTGFFEIWSGNLRSFND